MADSAQALASYLGALEKMYGDTGERRYVSTLHTWPREQEAVVPLDEAITQAMTDIAEGRR